MACLTKSRFPTKLRELVNALDEGNGRENLVSGFRKCGIAPLNRQEVLQMLPEGQEEHLNLASGVDEQILEILREMRRGPDNNRAQKPRGRLNVVPGRSVSTPRVPENEDSSSSDDESDEDVVETHAAQEEPEDREEHTDRDETVGPSEQNSGETMVKAGDWLLVRFIGGKRGKSEFRYVVQALRNMDEDQEILCQGYRSKDLVKTKFALKESDTFYVGLDEIISFLKEPETKISNTGRTVVVEFAETVTLRRFSALLSVHVYCAKKLFIAFVHVKTSCFFFFTRKHASLLLF